MSDYDKNFLKEKIIISKSVNATWHNAPIKQKNRALEETLGISFSRK